MAEKKMTQVEALENAIAVLLEVGSTDEAEDTIAVLRHMVEKRKAPRKPKVNEEAVAFRAELVDILANADEPMTNAEIVDACPRTFDEDGNEVKVKSQRVANNLRVLIKDGKVVRHRSDTPSGKDTFSLA